MFEWTTYKPICIGPGYLLMVMAKSTVNLHRCKRPYGLQDLKPSLRDL